MDIFHRCYRKMTAEFAILKRKTSPDTVQTNGCPFQDLGSVEYRVLRDHCHEYMFLGSSTRLGFRVRDGCA